MTCKELHLYFENVVRLDFETAAASPDVAEHLGTCAQCQQFVDRESDVRKSLQLVRVSLPQISPSLDEEVLGRFREHIRQGRVAAIQPTGPRRIKVAAVRWGMALAALLIVAIVLLPHRKTISLNTQTQPSQAANFVRQPDNQDPGAESQKKTLVTRRKLDSGLARRRTIRSLPPNPAISVPAEFGSLMYCDQFSCSGTMEIIRVQLASPMPSTDSVDRGHEPVYADVLVGSDGIARGIRFER